MSFQCYPECHESIFDELVGKINHVVGGSVGIVLYQSIKTASRGC